MKMTREEAIRNFREHWASLAISGSEDKEDYLRRNGFPEIKNDCFLCEFVQDTQSDITCLKKCPIEWPATSEQGVQPCKRSYYDDWRNATTPEERKRLAAIIRDLPEKKVEPEFKIGDRVRVKARMRYQGKIGVITEILNGGYPLYGVESDENCFSSGRWNRNHPEKCGRGYYFRDYMLELLPSINLCPEPKTITESKTFTFKGNKTVCTIEIDGRKWTGVAKCDPNDQWNEEIGRQWAELRANRKMLDAVEKELRRQ